MGLRLRQTGKWGLRFEVVVGLGLLVAASVGFMGLVIFQYTQREMVALKVDIGLLLTRVVEDRLNMSRPGADLTPLLEALDGSGFDAMVITDAQGRVKASRGPAFDMKRFSEVNLKLALTSREAQVHVSGDYLFSLVDENISLTLAVPLFKDVRVVGAVGLYSSFPQLKPVWKRIRKVLLFYLVFDTLVTVVFGAYVLSKRLVEPLRRMVRRVEDLASGRYEPYTGKRESALEIALLEEAFEDMAGRLLESQAQLEKNFASLKEAQEGLIRSEKMATVGRLGAGVAHEIGNPLASMLGFVHLLKRDDLTLEERADFLSRAEKEIQRMDGIIRALLDFSRPAPSPEPGPVDLAAIAEHALALATVQKRFVQVDVETRFAPDLPAGRGEANRLTQVLLNLLDNAAQAMEGRGRVTLTTGLAETWVYLEVADTGPGINAEDLPHIFEPFFTSKEPGQGTGLGLSVSLSIVESLGGKLTVESEPGRGSVFTVYLKTEPAPGVEEGLK